MPEVTPVHIDDQLTALIDGALDARNPFVVAYVDKTEQARLSFRGSVQGFSSDQLAIWIREAHGGLVTALSNNPRISMMYRDKERRITYLFYGRARVENDPIISKAIFEKSPKRERDKDPDMNGVAIVVDIDEIQGGPLDQPVYMRRQ